MEEMISIFLMENNQCLFKVFLQGHSQEVFSIVDHLSNMNKAIQSERPLGELKQKVILKIKYF